MAMQDLQATNELQLSVDAGVCRIKLNRPERRNALSLTLMEDLDAAFTRIADDPSIRVVVISGAGPVFCAGHDLSEMTGLGEAEYHRLFSLCSRMMQAIRRLPQPVIAQVHGIATAAGCQLVAACDLAVAATDAKFATPGVKIGLFCTTPMVPLVRSVPPKVAMEMLLTGQPISADRALAAGLVNQVVPSAELDAAVERIVQAILATSPLVVRMGKQAFYRQLHLSEADAYEDAVDVMTQNSLCHDAQEGMTAFLQKRPPQWTGT
jgi:enoyl-CoA hydratase/carnithine racemase